MVVNKKSKNKNWKLSVGVAVIFKQTNEKQKYEHIFWHLFFSRISSIGDRMNRHV